MDSRDRRLGMGIAISRRDFTNVYAAQLATRIKIDLGDGVLPGKRGIRQVAFRVHEQV